MDQGGGVMLCIQDSIQYVELGFNPYIHILENGNTRTSNIEILGAKIFIDNKWLNIVVIYSPDQNVPEKEFNHYFQQIPKPNLIFGDFNSRHEQWEPEMDRDSRNKSGKELFKTLIASDNISLLSPPGLHTRFDPKTGEGSVLDLFLGDSTVFSNAVMGLGPQLPSDHQPVIAKFNNITYKEFIGKLPRRRIAETQWSLFENQLAKLRHTGTHFFT